MYDEQAFIDVIEALQKLSNTIKYPAGKNIVIACITMIGSLEVITRRFLQ